LEIGGGNDISNLWPENSKITGGSLTKDKFENYLHDQVCSNKITVQEAQKEISSNWLKYYQEYLSSGTTPKKTTQVANTNATTTSASVPAGATGKCNDGTYTYSVTHRGACSKHGGVSKWY
jgi:Tfp pilus assembly protein FimT